MHALGHPKVSGDITPLTVAKFCAAMDTLIDQYGFVDFVNIFSKVNLSAVISLFFHMD